MKEKKNVDCVVVYKRDAAFNELADFYNNNTTFKKISVITEQHKKLLIPSLYRYGVEGIKECFARAESSNYLSGRKGGDWRADFDWLIVPEHIERIRDGKYDDFKYNNTNNQNMNFNINCQRNHEYTAEVSSMQSFDDEEFIAAALARGFSDMVT